MANSKGNTEIMDVLSSIRRLVSEDRRVPPTDRVEPTLRGPVAEEDLLAGASSGDQLPDAPMADASADRAAFIADRREADPLQAEAEVAALASGPPRVSGENRFVLTAALRVGEEEDGIAELAEPVADEPSTLRMRPAGAPERPARDLASLEDTIAELEAAVAGIEEEFEPDGGDAPAHAELTSVGAMPGWPVAERAFPVTGRFQGIMAGFEPMPMADDRLDQPITGDVTVPATRRSEDRQGGTGLGGGFFRAAARSGDSIPEVPEAPIAEAAPAVAEVDLAGSEPASGEAAIAEPTDAVEGPHVEGPEVVPPHDEDADEDERAYSRPIILRSRIAEPEPVSADDVVAMEVAAEPPTESVRMDLRSEDDLTAEERDVDGTEEGDLFDPLADADFDIDTLRDMVAEIVRDELRGTLGERITRNLRGLVRREIDRVLIAEGLKRG